MGFRGGGTVGKKRKTLKEESREGVTCALKAGKGRMGERKRRGGEKGRKMKRHTRPFQKGGRTVVKGEG